MYFPYLRGRQFELIALRELVENGIIGDKIIPIIEPVKLTSTLLKTLNAFSNNGKRYAMIMNPEVGEFSKALREKKEDNDVLAESVSEALDSENNIKAYLMRSGVEQYIDSAETDISSIISISTNRDCMDEYARDFASAKPMYALIPSDRRFGRLVGNRQVLLEDCFSKAQKNADYGSNDDEFYSDTHLYYRDEGFKGFSDYSIVGSEYQASGFAPLAVAIHIVYFDTNDELRVHHFVSDSNDDINDPAGKYGEAVKKLKDWVYDNDIKATMGLNGLLKSCEIGKYPGLGTVKKYSIMHHLELMNGFLEE